MISRRRAGKGYTARLESVGWRPGHDRCLSVGLAAQQAEAEMNAFIVKGQDRPGGLAEVAEAVAERGINITSIAGITWDGVGAIALTTNDEAGTRSILAQKGFETREVELVPASLEDKPGALAGITRKLADAGINLELLLPMGMRDGKVTVAFATSDAAKTRATISMESLASA